MSMEIVNTIWKQIVAGGMIKVWSWGVPLNSRVGSSEEGWLRFKVSGRKFKGIVKVTYLPGNDLYKIDFLKVIKVENELSGRKETDYKIEHTIADVYCDQLTELIDEYVEKIPAYAH